MIRHAQTVAARSETLLADALGVAALIVITAVSLHLPVLF